MMSEPTDYQAFSPDEVVLVKFHRSLGGALTYRDLTSMTFTVGVVAQLHIYTTVKMFPFSSEGKCMGIIVRERTGSCSGGKAQETVKFCMKGGDAKMASVIRRSDWLNECCQEVVQKGLHTLIFAIRTLSEGMFNIFLRQYEAAMSNLGEGRAEAIEAAMKLLERERDDAQWGDRGGRRVTRRCYGFSRGARHVQHQGVDAH
ncbi:hypothetical protein Q4I28_003221 [Leishmania naiffi]|uniref:Uncharacterized protein n=1 Tax=Leishmania naiffi TaxID=5678 RepID=A0AAW3BWW3_9TRYP